MKKDIRNTIKQIFKIFSWTIVVLLVGVIFFLVFIVISTKICEKSGKEPIISLYTIISPSMTPNIKVYDVVFVARTNTKKLKRGDVISFYVRNSNIGDTPVTHRILTSSLLSSGEYSFITKGDYNSEQDNWQIKESDIIGKVLFKLPGLGRVQFFLTSKRGWFIIILLPALIIIAYDLYKLIKLIIIKSKINEKEDIK